MWSGGDIVAQQLKYDVILLGDKVGETIIDVKDSAGYKHYTLRNTTDVKMLFWHKKSWMATDVVYAQTTNRSGQLLIEKDGTRTSLNSVVSYSTLPMFYSEPTNIKTVYSERLGEFFDLKKEGNGKYSAHTSSNNAVYTYANGKLAVLEMKSTLGSITMKLAK